jgi:hypothetical protein
MDHIRVRFCRNPRGLDDVEVRVDKPALAKDVSQDLDRAAENRLASAIETGGISNQKESVSMRRGHPGEPGTRRLRLDRRSIRSRLTFAGLLRDNRSASSRAVIPLCGV